nr:hypothetical protein [Tanacetum cinerariifolium]
NGTKRTIRSTPATTTTTTTTSVTDAQLKALIDQGIANALAARDADRSRNGKDSHNSGMGARRQAPPTREMKTVFRISNCSVENQTKFATCTLLADLKKKMINKYFLMGKIKKLKRELWNLRVKSNDVVGYNQRFQELALLCDRMFPEESNKVERYVSGLPDMIHRSVVASRPKTMQKAIEMASELMDKRNNTFAERQAENNRKSGEKKPYGGFKPLCPKCNYHHNGPCAPKCYKCTRVGHLARDWKSLANAINNQRGTGTGQKPTSYECGNQGHYMSDYHELKNQNHGNQTEGTGAHGMVHALGGETN